VIIGYYDPNLGGIESNVVYGVQRILLGRQLYQDPASGAYAVMQYTPLFYYVAAATGKVLGISGTDAHGVYALCRALALLFNLLTILVFAGIMRMRGMGRQDALIAALPVLIILTVHFYTRGDSMYLFFFVAATYYYLRYNIKAGVVNMLIAALCSAACIMTKQTGILIIGVTGFCLLFIDRKLLMAILYAVATLVFSLAVFYLCLGRQNMEFMYRNACLGLKNGFDFTFPAQMFGSQYFLDIVPCYVVGGIFLWLVSKKVTDKAFKATAAAAAICFAFASVTGLKIGSSNNYFIEFLVFVLIGIPYLLQHPAADLRFFTLFKRPVTIRLFTLIAFFVVISSKTMGLFSAVCVEHSFKNDVTEYNNEIALRHLFIDELHIAPGEHIFFTERYFLDNVFIEYAIMPNKDLTTEVYNAGPNTYDYSSFAAGMNTGLIKYIVTSETNTNINRIHQYIPFVKFDNFRFRLIGHKFGYCIYEYAPAQVSRKIS
jgi:hypothetical protein